MLQAHIKKWKYKWVNIMKGKWHIRAMDVECNRQGHEDGRIE